MERYAQGLERQVELLETDLKSWYQDLSEAFALRDWQRVASIYRRIAAVADRLEEIDAGAYSRVLAAAEAEQEVYLVDPEEIMVGEEGAYDADRSDGEGRSGDPG